MQRLDPPHDLRSSRAAALLPTLGEVESLGVKLEADEWTLSELVELVDASPGLQRAVMRMVYSAEFSLSQPVEGTWHALALLGVKRLERLTDGLLRELTAEAARAAS